jgi:hypothetical protein
MPAPYDYSVEIADPTKSFLSAFQTGASIKDTQLKQEKQQQQLDQQKIIQEGFNKLRQPGATAADYANLSMMLPETQAKAVRESFGMLSTERQQTALQGSGQVFSAFKSGKPEIAISLMEQQIEGKRNSGDEAGAKFLETWRDVAKVDPKATEDYFGFTISQMPGGDKVITSAIALGGEGRAAAEAPSKLSEQVAKASKALTAAEVAVATAPDDIARATALREFEQAKATKEKVDARYADRKNKLNIRKLERELTSEGKNDGVQSSKITPDGTSIIVTKSGNTRVIGADGVELTGQARVDAVRGSEVFGADIQALRSGSRKAGEIGQVEAQKAFVTLGKIATNISNLDSAVAALDAGATTGVIASKFPNWRASTIELKNIQRNLGLDIIGSVTFGALSEGELSLALETALPLNMNEKELKDWLIRKKNAQVKLSDYITEQARFLSVPGQTIGQWLQQSEKIGGRPGGMTAPGTGSTVTVDY